MIEGGITSTPPNAWARISEVAEKLGVEPLKAGHAPTIVATGADGKNYDVWEVASRFLDKIAERGV